MQVDAGNAKRSHHHASFRQASVRCAPEKLHYTRDICMLMHARRLDAILLHASETQHCAAHLARTPPGRSPSSLFRAPATAPARRPAAAAPPGGPGLRRGCGSQGLWREYSHRQCHRDGNLPHTPCATAWPWADAASESRCNRYIRHWQPWPHRERTVLFHNRLTVSMSCL